MIGSAALRIAGCAAARFVIALAVYGAAELLSSAVFGAAARMPLWMVLLATAVVAWLFWLTGGPIRRLVDHVVLGERAGGYEAGRALLRRMSTTLPVDEVAPALAETAGRTMHSNRAEVRLLMSDGDSWSQVWPQRAVADGAQVTVGVRHGGSDVGELEVDLVDPDESERDRGLLADLARPAGLALSTVRLTVELRRRAVDLEAVTAALVRSNLRILDARRTELARLAVEMDQRVLPHLDRAESALDAELLERPDFAARLDAARGDVAAALDALRVLARGIYPPRLADAGLDVSLEGWQQRSGIVFDLTMRGDQGALHGVPAVESSLYFVVVTALGALSAEPRPTVVVDVDDAEVRAEVTGVLNAGVRTAGRRTGGVLTDSDSDSDFGSGSGDPVADNMAMQAVRDRVDAFAGRAELTADPAGPGAGSVLHVRIPLIDPGSAEPLAAGVAAAFDPAAVTVHPAVEESGGRQR